MGWNVDKIVILSLEMQTVLWRVKFVGQVKQLVGVPEQVKQLELHEKVFPVETPLRFVVRKYADEATVHLPLLSQLLHPVPQAIQVFDGPK